MKLEHDILSLSPPQRRSLKYLREVFGNRRPGDTTPHAPMIHGEMGKHLDDESDLSLVAPPMDQDRLTALLEGRFAWLVRVRIPSIGSFFVRSGANIAYTPNRAK